MGVNATPVAPGMKFVPHYRFALYTQVEGGIILAQSQQPILNELAPVAPSDRGVPGKTNGPQTASYTVNVYISGRVTFVSNHAVWKGVSDVPVYLRWGGTPTLTGGLPPGHPEGLHQSYDIADRDGYFVFNYSFQSNVPAHELAEHILVYAGMANSAAYDGDAGVGAPFTEFLAIPIDGITTTITVPDTNYAVNGVAGSALRYLYHAKQFALQRFGMSETQLNLMMYKRRTGGTTHFTAPHSSSEQYVEFIEFHDFPIANTVYHEYGHFIDYRVSYLENDRFLPDEDCEGHFFSLVTNDVCTTSEGWAEFIAAAANNYWYAQAPGHLGFRLEAPRWDNNIGFVTDFFEDLQSRLPAASRERMEGAFAVYLYNLWDSSARRAPSYEGDNDDVSISSTVLLNCFEACNNRVLEYPQLHPPCTFQFFSDCIESAVLSGQASLRGVRDAILMNDASRARSASPIEVQVQGSGFRRTLSWEDATSPDEVSYFQEGAELVTLAIAENNETGFVVYRKATTSPWNGTLTGYSVIGSTPPDVTSFVDNDVVAGTYSYVVVAANASGESRPVTETSITVAPAPSVSAGDPGVLRTCPAGDGDWLQVTVDFDDASMSGSVPLWELALGEPMGNCEMWTWQGQSPTADYDATAANGYATTITVPHLSGCGPCTFPVLRNGLLVGEAEVALRAYDTMSSLGYVDAGEISRWAAAAGSCLPSNPATYDACVDWVMPPAPPGAACSTGVDAGDLPAFAAHLGDGRSPFWEKGLSTSSADIPLCQHA
jgi:hypothetical protein